MTKSINNENFVSYPYFETKKITPINDNKSYKNQPVSIVNDYLFLLQLKPFLCTRVFPFTCDILGNKNIISTRRLVLLELLELP